MIAGFNDVFSGDNGTYIQYALKVKDFDTTGFFISKGSDHEINIKNSAGCILKFRVNDKDELLTYHCGIAFIYFEFANGWLNRYKTLDINGVLKGDDEFEDLAIVEYEIKKMNLLHAKFEVLNEADGNIPMNDAKDEIVYTKVYDSKNKLIRENYISSKEYWNASNVLYKP
ncbi:MAG TPA: hypothetical protein PKE39_01345 [Ignavibacteria bacterium]|nr:hypothetical protein [Ignavibacteria bacterium]HMQ97642.1 hypothetical protein [Ignavibacteria bacterium]